MQHLASHVESRGGHFAGLTYQADANVLSIGLEMIGRNSVPTLAPCDKLNGLLPARDTCPENKKDARTGPLRSGVEGGGGQYSISQGIAASRSQDLRDGAKMVAWAYQLESVSTT